MSEQVQKIGFGSINDNDDSLKGKSGGGKFGLNQGFITKLEFNPNAGKDGSAGDAVDITFIVGEKEFRRRIYNVTRVYDKDSNELTDDNDPEFIKIYNQNMAQNMAVVIHAVKATGVTQEQIDTALATPPSNFADWAKIVTALAPADFDKKPIDGFLEYQWKIGDDQDRTYLELPKNMKGGRFLAPHVAPNGKWTEENEWVEKNEETGEEKSCEGLRYVDDSKNVHTFVRNSAYMESPKANQQIDGQDTAQAITSPSPQNAKKSSW